MILTDSKDSFIYLLLNHLLADIISLLGTTDFVLGSIDRLNS